MGEAHVYDKAKYHLGDVRKAGLAEEHAAHHLLYFVRWLLGKGLLAPELLDRSSAILAKQRTGEARLHDVLAWWDDGLLSDMLTDEGDRFARHYYELGKGAYAADYAQTLLRGEPTIYHVAWSEENWRRLEPVIERRWEEWKRPKRRWWPFGGASRS